MLHSDPFGQRPRQGGMDNFRREQRQSQHPRHIRLILAVAPL